MPRRIARRTTKRRSTRRTTKRVKRTAKQAVRISGHGDYMLSKNSLLSGQTPAFGQNSKPIRIIHKEFVTSVKVNANGTFRNDGYYVNPGNVALFPWLSQIALMYDSYDLNGLIVYYKSYSADTITNVSTASTTQINNLGVPELVLVSDYNVSDALHESKVSALNTEFAVSGKTTRDLIHAVECANELSVFGGKRFITDKIEPSQFIDVAGRFAPQDPVKYFFNTLNVITQGGSIVTGQPDYECGELWISYDITLYKPAPQVNSLPQQLWCEYASVWTAATPAGRAVLTDTNLLVTPLGNKPQRQGGNFSVFTKGIDQGYHTGAVSGYTPLAISEGQEIVFPAWVNSGLYKFTLGFHCYTNSLGTGGYWDWCAYTNGATHSGSKLTWDKCNQTTFACRQTGDTTHSNTSMSRNIEHGYCPNVNTQLKNSVYTQGNRAPYNVAKKSCIGREWAAGTYEIVMDPVYFRITGPNAKWVLPCAVYRGDTGKHTQYCDDTGTGGVTHAWALQNTDVDDVTSVWWRIEEVNDSF